MQNHFVQVAVQEMVLPPVSLMLYVMLSEEGGVKVPDPEKVYGPPCAVLVADWLGIVMVLSETVAVMVNPDA